MSNQPEVWLRGPLPEVPAILQPVGHALLQACEEVEAFMLNFHEEFLWTRPGGVASVGFHLQHMTGVVDRMFTYARGEALDAKQWKDLQAEGQPDPAIQSRELVVAFRRQVDRALSELRGFDEGMLCHSRTVGRNRLPSTVIGLLTHAAEHVQRHLGQLLVTARIQGN